MIRRFWGAARRGWAGGGAGGFFGGGGGSAVSPGGGGGGSGHLDASVIHGAMNTNVREGDGMVTFTYRVVPELLLQPEHVRPTQSRSPLS